MKHYSRPLGSRGQSVCDKDTGESPQRYKNVNMVEATIKKMRNSYNKLGNHVQAGEGGRL